MAEHSMNNVLGKIDNVFSTIKQVIRQGTDYNSCVMVEGQDDYKFIRRFIGEDVYLITSWCGKPGIEKIIDDDVYNEPKFIGICDRDYSVATDNQRLFFYDHCCLEMMLIGCDDVFHAMCCEFYKKEGCSEQKSKELKEKILNELEYVSKFRQKNEKASLAIKFQGLKFTDMIDSKGIFNRQKFLEKIREINGDDKNDAVDELILEVQSDEISESLLHITNGHDFIEYFKIICDFCSQNGEGQLGKAQYNPTNYSQVMRSSFTKSMLHSTTLYNDIKEYSTNQGIVFLK